MNNGGNGGSRGGNKKGGGSGSGGDTKGHQGRGGSKGVSTARSKVKPARAKGHIFAVGDTVEGLPNPPPLNSFSSTPNLIFTTLYFNPCYFTFLM